jgi:flagellar M-ring protein FliF
LLSAPQGNSEFAARDKQLEIARNTEERYTQRIEQLLTPLVGPGRVRAQVVADVEMSSTEEAREQYRPESQVVRSEQSAEESSRNGGGPQGIPGALSNQPPTPGSVLPPGASASTPAPAPAATGVTPPDNTSKQSTRNYEIDRTMAYTKLPAGRIKRLTVAVLVDNLRNTDEEGTVTETPISPEQIENMTRLVKDAVGFDQARGDSVNVINSSFKGETPEEDAQPEVTPWWERPLVRDIAKLLAGLIALLALVFVVLRPLVRGLLSAPVLNYVPLTASQAALANAQPALPALDYEAQVAQARSLVTQDPRRVAQVVKTWVGNDE